MENPFHSPTTIGDSITATLSFSFPLRRCFIGDLSDLRYAHDSDDRSPADDAFSMSFLVLDLIWHLAFVFVSVFVLLWTVKEKPSTPLRVWICVYALQCLLHVGFVYFGHRRRIHRDCDRVCGGFCDSHGCRSIMKRLESANTIASSFWWVIGFYFLVAGGQPLLHDSPCLYWLTVVFLALDVIFMIFCLAMACIICVAVFCCIPIVAIAYAMTITEGATEDDIRLLPKYRFCSSYLPRTSASDLKQIGGVAVEFGSRNFINELALLPEDSECCICLSRYIEGAELCTLPCNHHFHHGCITRWLRINATCPLCKFNILRSDTLV